MTCSFHATRTSLVLSVMLFPFYLLAQITHLGARRTTTYGEWLDTHVRPLTRETNTDLSGGIPYAPNSLRGVALPSKEKLTQGKESYDGSRNDKDWKIRCLWKCWIND